MNDAIISVDSLCKSYPKFKLSNVSFNLEKGKITGFIGRNGAGKTTTLKSLLNLVHSDSGNITFFGKTFAESELEIKQKIGFVSGGFSYYAKNKLKDITAVTKSFYNEWDSSSYQKYMELFKLDEDKTSEQLSEGMKVKYALTLALSHNAELLLLDEPTSGLDPVSRDDLLEVFLHLCKTRNITILFSTHITSDLDKCAENIIYIKDGKIIFSSSKENFLTTYNDSNLENIMITLEKVNYDE